MASSTIKQPDSSKPIRIYQFEETTSSSYINMPTDPKWITGVFVWSPSNIIAVKGSTSSGNTLKVFRLEWDGSVSRFALKELEDGTTVKGTAIYY